MDRPQGQLLNVHIRSKIRAFHDEDTPHRMAQSQPPNPGGDVGTLVVSRCTWSTDPSIGRTSQVRARLVKVLVLSQTLKHDGRHYLAQRILFCNPLDGIDCEPYRL